MLNILINTQEKLKVSLNIMNSNNLVKIYQIVDWRVMDDLSSDLSSDIYFSPNFCF